jgi:hypothetical protein
MIEYLVFGWSLGGLSIIMIQMGYDSWTSYRMDLREAARCKCRGEEE